MVIPCPTRSRCDTDNPFANLTSEAPDSEVFIGRFFPSTVPPLEGNSPTRYVSGNCAGVCTSTISQQAANICAAQLATDICLEDPPRLPDDDPCVMLGGCSFTPPAPPRWPPPPPNHPPACNEPQECCAPCPDGTDFCFEVPACTFFSTNVARANAIAHSYACRRAVIERVCILGSLGSACLGVSYISTLIAIGGTGIFSWDVNDGSLPPGMVISPSSDTTQLFIGGTPTATGTFNFNIRITDTLGGFMVRPYSISVMGITTSSPLPEAQSATPYSAQISAGGGSGSFTFSLASGSLPDGLSMSSSGLISGTITGEAASQDFVVRVTDSGGAFCDKPFTLPTSSGFKNTLRSYDPCSGYVAATTIPDLPLDGAWTYSTSGIVYTTAGKYTSLISQADANNQASAAAFNRYLAYLGGGGTSPICCPTNQAHQVSEVHTWITEIATAPPPGLIDALAMDAGDGVFAFHGDATYPEPFQLFIRVPGDQSDGTFCNTHGTYEITVEVDVATNVPGGVFDINLVLGNDLSVGGGNPSDYADYFGVGPGTYGLTNTVGPGPVIIWVLISCPQLADGSKTASGAVRIRPLTAP